MAKVVRQRVRDGVREKQCVQCGNWLPLADWPRYPTDIPGRHAGTLKPMCSPDCTRAYHVALYRTDPSKQHAASKRWIAKNRDRVNAYAREYHRKRAAATKDERKAAAKGRRLARRAEKLAAFQRDGKRCPACGETKPLTEFGWNKAADWPESRCKPCRSTAVWQAYRKKHPAKYPQGRPHAPLPAAVGDRFRLATGSHRVIHAYRDGMYRVEMIAPDGWVLTDQKWMTLETVRRAINEGKWMKVGAPVTYVRAGEDRAGIVVISDNGETVRFRLVTDRYPDGGPAIHHIRRQDVDRLLAMGYWIPADGREQCASASTTDS